MTDIQTTHDMSNNNNNNESITEKNENINMNNDLTNPNLPKNIISQEDKKDKEYQYTIENKYINDINEKNSQQQIIEVIEEPSFISNIDYNKEIINSPIKNTELLYNKSNISNNKQSLTPGSATQSTTTLKSFVNIDNEDNNNTNSSNNKRIPYSSNVIKSNNLFINYNDEVNNKVDFNSEDVSGFINDSNLNAILKGNNNSFTQDANNTNISNLNYYSNNNIRSSRVSYLNKTRSYNNNESNLNYSVFNHNNIPNYNHNYNYNPNNNSNCEEINNNFYNNTNIPDFNQILYKFKIILIGNVNVGKTCIMKSFIDSALERSTIFSTNNTNLSCYNNNNHNQSSSNINKQPKKKNNINQCSIGVQTDYKTIILDEGINVDIQIWDTSGEERFKTITKQYYRNANGVILVFDITDRHSFNDINHWLSDIKDNGPDNINMIIVGNKVDIAEQREVSFEEANELCRQLEVDYIEISALENLNIDLLFAILSKEMIISCEEELALKYEKYNKEEDCLEDENNEEDNDYCKQYNRGGRITITSKSKYEIDRNEFGLKKSVSQKQHKEIFEIENGKKKKKKCC